MYPEQKSNKIKFIIVAVVVLGFVAAGFFFLMPKPTPETKDLYCYIYDDLTVKGYPIQQCSIMRVSSPHLDQIEVDSLLAVNVTQIQCADTLEELPECEMNELYFSYYPLNMFCTTPACDAVGNLCIAYSIKYLDNNTGLREQYEATLMQRKVDFPAEWNTLIRDCARN